MPETQLCGIALKIPRLFADFLQRIGGFLPLTDRGLCMVFRIS